MRLLSSTTLATAVQRRWPTVFRNNRKLSSKTDKSVSGLDKPIPFLSSPAAGRFVVPPVRRVNIDMPWYQPYSVVGSVAALLIYFCILREENDVDKEFSKTLYDRIKGLEKQQLLLSYKYNKEQGLSVVEIEKRLKEITEMEGLEAPESNYL